MTLPAEVAVVGRFPPPLDGQTLATARLAELVSTACPVVTVSTSAPRVRASSGRRFGPKIRSATTKMISSSHIPMPNMGER